MDQNDWIINDYMRGPWSHSEHYNPSFRNLAVDLTFIYFRFPIPYKMNSIIETYWVIVKIKYYSVCWMLHFKLYKNIHLCVKYYPFPKYFLEKITITSNFMGIKAISKLFFFQKFSAFFIEKHTVWISSLSWFWKCFYILLHNNV